MDIFIRQQLLNAESTVREHTAKVARARNLPGARALPVAAARKAQELIEVELRELEKMETSQHREEFMRRYRSDWQLLRGNYPTVFLLIERKMRQIPPLIP